MNAGVHVGIRVEMGELSAIRDHMVVLPSSGKQFLVGLGGGSSAATARAGKVGSIGFFGGGNASRRRQRERI